MKPDRREHIVHAIRLRRQSALASARMYARELRIERMDGHERREAIDAHYQHLMHSYREDARACSHALRILGDR